MYIRRRTGNVLTYFAETCSTVFDRLVLIAARPLKRARAAVQAGVLTVVLTASVTKKYGSEFGIL